MRLSNLVIDTSTSALKKVELCYHGPSFLRREKSFWRAETDGTFDFTTYFNSISYAKLLDLTTITQITLSVTLANAKGKITQTYMEALDSKPQLSDNTIEFDVAEPTTLNLPIEHFAHAIIVGWQIETESGFDLYHASYEVELSAPERDIEFVMSTTTFKKENYILSNIEKVKQEICAVDDDFAKHFHMYVVDNGRTLDAQKVSDDQITIIPNENVGGAGGFVRGMIAAMDQNPKATHILLMDDDIEVSTESIRRTYTLLKILKPEHQQKMISGAMLNLLEPDMQYEDLGFMDELGAFRPVKHPMRVSLPEALVLNETFDPSYISTNARHNYAAWWYCCIPMTQIEQNGLPLPVFVRADDAEYGTRCESGFITMNSIGVWHEPFHSRYNSAVERYQTYRNCLIAKHTTGFAPESKFIKLIERTFDLELKNFNYYSASLVADSFEDFLRGPDFYSAKGVVERRFMDANKNKEQLVDLETLAAQCAEHGIDFDPFDLTVQAIHHAEGRGFLQRLDDYLTDNRQKFRKSVGKGHAVMPHYGWAYQPAKTRGKRYIIAVDQHLKKGVIREKDTEKYDALLKRFQKLKARYKKEYKQIDAAYRKSRARVTSLEFWRDYLDL